MTAKMRQYVAMAIRDNSYSENKPWVLDFYHIFFGNRLFFFETKEKLKEFSDETGVKINNIFYLKKEACN